ncbi:MAG TPA: PadR family transcriptional regulator [Thermoleophilaceae bacterium]|nr:PadR family transcriptional regulator [Thermoleophilaceae bacterium]
MQEPRLTPTSYIVLGLLSWSGEATPYRLKQLVAGSVGFFWTLQHAQLYTEPERLARGGYVSERREESGRRRRLYRLTDKGREALTAWRAEPTGELSEVRDLALLKLFFGADPATLAAVQLEAHRAELAEYERIRASMPESLPEGPRLALEFGMRNARTWIGFWEELADRSSG